MPTSSSWHWTPSRRETLVLYYSQTGATKAVAEELQRQLGADIASIEAVEPYDADYAATVATKEAEAAKRALANVKPVYVDGQSLVFFPIGQSKFTEQDKLRLEQYVVQIKNGSSDKIYMIEGHADSATGSARVNQRLSEARAQSVYNYLVSKGINANQLKIKACGDKESPYGKPVNDRVVIVN